MKFLPMRADSGPADPETLRQDLRRGRRVGIVTLGERFLFVRKLRRCWYLPYAAVSRYFRRVQGVPVRMGCCDGEIRVENLVLCTADGGRERELAIVQLPGERAALAVMDALGRLAPDAASGCPPKGEAVP